MRPGLIALPTLDYLCYQQPNKGSDYAAADAQGCQKQAVDPAVDFRQPGVQSAVDFRQPGIHPAVEFMYGHRQFGYPAFRVAQRPVRFLRFCCHINHTKAPVCRSSYQSRAAGSIVTRPGPLDICPMTSKGDTIGAGAPPASWGPTPC